MALTVKQFLAQALLWKAWYKKATFFKHPDYNGGQLYNYEGIGKYDIFQWARKEFPFYNKYSTNEELTQRFAADFNSGNSLLLKEINAGATTQLQPPSTEPSPTQTASETPAIQEPVTKSGEANLPTTPPRPPTIRPIPQTIPPDQIIVAEPTVEPPAEAVAPPTEPAPNTMPTPTPSSPQISTPSFQPPRLNFPSFKMPNAAKDLGSSVGRFIKTNAGRIGRGIAGPGLSGAYNLLGKTGLGAMHHGGNFLNRLSDHRARLSASSASKKRLIWLAAGAFFLLVIFGAIGGIPGTTPTGETAPLPPISNNLTGCKFTRSGNSQPVKSSILLDWIIKAAASAGIPPQVLASVAMHENPDFTANADNNHDAIKSNQFCNRAPIFCEKNGQVLHRIDGKDDPCTPEEIANGARNAQAVGLMQIIDVYNPGKDLCSITESLSIAAAKLKADGLTAQPTQDQINKVINAYYNSCTYGSYSYCNEVWQDLQNCQATSGTTPSDPGPIGFSLSCPVGSNPSIICGTAANPVSGCGHGVAPKYPTRCNPYFYACDTSSTKYADGTYERYSPALYYAIDVAGVSEVKLPYINGNEPTTWTRAESQPIKIGQNAEWGYRVNFTATTSQDKKLYLDLTHLSAGLNNSSSLRSGETVGTVFADIGHLHFGLSVDGRWVEPIQEARMCAQ